MTLETEHLKLRGPDRTDQAEYLCVALAHNEQNLLDPFFSHYRKVGNITFLFVDDRSTDGTGDYLANQPDVTVMVPKEGSTYAEHKREWRGQVLDLVGEGRWILAPDIDEHLFWHGSLNRSFPKMIETLESEGADALFAIMLDMYADKPLAEHVFRSGSLVSSFPFFDDPRKDPTNTWMERAPSRFLRDWRTPELMVVGGMRQRVVDQNTVKISKRHALARRWFGHLRDHRNTSGKLLRRLTRSTGHLPPINLTKVPLVKWRRGLRFYGGAHALNGELKLASERAVILHYPITRGHEGIKNMASRGQNMGGSAYYKRLLSVASTNPCYEGSTKLDDLSSLVGITLAPSP